MLKILRYLGAKEDVPDSSLTTQELKNYYQLLKKTNNKKEPLEIKDFYQDMNADLVALVEETLRLNSSNRSSID